MSTVLAALDGAPSASVVLRSAATFARSLGARLVLLRVANLPVSAEVLRGSVDEERFAQRVREETLRLLEAQQSAIEPLAVELRVEVGPAAERILEAAEALQADLIVLGAAGDGGGSPQVGSVAQAVLMGAHTSVLVVRPGGAIRVL
jgi:nucleotide-binding universal stress UspA family protein